MLPVGEEEYLIYHRILYLEVTATRAVPVFLAAMPASDASSGLDFSKRLSRNAAIDTERTSAAFAREIATSWALVVGVDFTDPGMMELLPPAEKSLAPGTKPFLLIASSKTLMNSSTRSSRAREACYVYVYTYMY